jgi:hypothetical protein
MFSCSVARLSPLLGAVKRLLFLGANCLEGYHVARALARPKSGPTLRLGRLWQTEASLEAPTFLVSLSFPVPHFTLGSYFFERLNAEYCLSDVNLTVASPLHGESDPKAVFQDTKASLVRMPLASASCRESQPLQPLRVPRLIGSDTIKRHAWGCETDSRRHAKIAWLVHQDIAVFTSSAAP